MLGPNSAADDTFALISYNKLLYDLKGFKFPVQHTVHLIEKTPKFQNLNVPFYWLVPIIKIF